MHDGKQERIELGSGHTGYFLHGLIRMTVGQGAQNNVGELLPTVRIFSYVMLQPLSAEILNASPRLKKWLMSLPFLVILLVWQAWCLRKHYKYHGVYDMS